MSGALSNNDEYAHVHFIGDISGYNFLPLLIKNAANQRESQPVI